ncbi:MAG: hypothetical protein HFE63_05500 [Clostridiales bacterium]|nr:hypothetical protein [Clostridiales bacterium]
MENMQITNYDHNEITSGIIDNTRIDKANYTLSLAAEAQRVGLCTAEQYNDFELRIFDRLADMIKAYTDGESSSVENSTAVMLLGSILYSTDLVLSRIPTDKAILQLFGDQSATFESIEALQHAGIRLNRELMLKALSQLRAVKRSRIKAPCIEYNRLLNATIAELIHSYDVYFDAKRNFTHVSYPMPTVNKSVCGIGGLLHMLDELQVENQFVNSFDGDSLDALWKRCAREISSATGVPINLGQLVFEQAILSLMSGRREPAVPLSAENARTLAQRDISSDEAYYSALNVIHKLEARANERYLQKLLERMRGQLSAIFSIETPAGREKAIRRFAWINGKG